MAQRKRGESTTLQERLEIIERASQGQSDGTIAATMGLARSTVRKWRRRYQREGRQGLVSRMGRPTCGALGSYPLALREAIRQMREAHPGWGPLTIRTELARHPLWQDQRLPSRVRIAAFLKEQGLVRPYQRHTVLPQPQPPAVLAPHQVWEVDAQGTISVQGLGPLTPINITDLATGLKVAALATTHVPRPRTEDYQWAFRYAFLEFGLPQQVTTDHDGVFFENTSASPFPTRLHLWLLALGVAVRFITQPPPYEHSHIERTHQTLYKQALEGQTFHDWFTLQGHLDQRRHFLNRYYPSRSLNGQAPLQAFPHAAHSDRPYRLEWEEEMLSLERVYHFLAQGRWFRQVTQQGQFSLGGQRYGLGQAYAGQQVEITFTPSTRQLVCQGASGEKLASLPIRGLTKAELLGNLAPLLTAKPYQFALPFSLQSWYQMLAAQRLQDTTL